VRELERDGIVLRTVYPQIPPRVEYQLTKVGIALRPALRALLAWAALRKEAMRPSSIATPHLKCSLLSRFWTRFRVYGGLSANTK
jgi:DNA-binding HxlR family transcriptional regulator